jgi:hypothetical protein
MDIRRRAQIGGIKKTSSGGGSTGGTYTVNLNGQWEATTAVPNPDSTLYDGVYRSSSNYNVNSGVAIMYITIKDCSSFKMYIRSYAESNYDYVMVSQLDKTITGSSSYSDTTLVKAHTRGNQQSGTALSNYTLVEFTGITSGEHTITVVYRKDSSAHGGDDRGYVLIEKSQAGSGGSTPDNPGTGGDTSDPINTSNYMTILALENGLTAKLSTNACQYCIDGDGNWIDLPSGTTTQSINSGQTLSFRGNLTPNSSNGIGTFTISKKCNLEGNCMSMLFGDNAVNNYSLSGKKYAFYKLFNGCTTIIQVSDTFLPATTLTDNCYSNMFYGCTSLTVAPELPATTLVSFCYNSMFYGCTSLTTAPELPATKLSNYCYYNMFYDCSSLTTAPELPATKLYSDCYYRMFRGCTSLTQAPELPATTLADYCYSNMFNGCSSLTVAPELPATTLDNNCYSNMFYGCSSLTTAPELPATKLYSDCYYNMFNGCSSLTVAPELPATTLARSCYEYMFYGCSKLTTAPELPATTLADRCYYNMFQGCRNLNYIKMLATNISATDCLTSWVYGVSNTGTFVKNPAMTSLPNGINGIPNGWTVYNDGEEPDGNLITFTVDGVEYQAEEGMTWNDFIGSKYDDRKFSVNVNNNFVYYNNRQLTVSGGFILSGGLIDNGVVYYTTSGGAD